MFNYIKYRAIGFELRTIGNNPSSTYIEVTFIPLNDKLKIKEEPVLIFDLDDILKMPLPPKAIMTAKELNEIDNLPYKKWIRKATLVFDHVRHHLKKKPIKIYF